MLHWLAGWLCGPWPGERRGGGRKCFFFVTEGEGGGHPPMAGHTQLSQVKPDCRGPEAKPHRLSAWQVLGQSL